MKYRALRILATVYKILAWIILVTGSISAISVLFGTGIISSGLGIPVTFSASLITALLLEGFTLLQFVFFLGLGELINLVFDIEANTRPAVKVEAMEEKKAA